MNIHRSIPPILLRKKALLLCALAALLIPLFSGQSPAARAASIARNAPLTAHPRQQTSKHLTPLISTSSSTVPYPVGYSPTLHAVGTAGFDGDSQSSDFVTGWGDDAWIFDFNQPAIITVTIIDCCLVGDNYEVYITRDLTQSEDLIGTTPPEDMNGSTLSSGTFSRLVASGAHYITVRDPGGVYWYNQGNSQYFPAGYHVTINVQLTKIAHPIVFVHGINDDASKVLKRDNFGALFTALEATYDTSKIKAFTYVDDHSLSKKCPPIFPHGCVSQSKVLDNAVSLAKLVQQLYTSAGQTKVTLIGNSMGGAIIRTMLAGCLSEISSAATPGCGSAATMVDNVFFIEGVQQGSWIDADQAMQNQIIQSNQLDDLSSTQLMLFLQPPVSLWKGLHSDYPAEQDLQPQSANIKAHNAVDPPRGIHYFNFYGDIQVQQQVTILGWTIAPPETISLGDLIILPGTDNPRDTPISGGSRFCQKCTTRHGYSSSQPDAQTSYTQWALTDVVPWDVDRILDYLEAPGADSTALFGSLSSRPEVHWNIGQDKSLQNILVQDASGTGGQVPIPEEILLQMEKGENMEP